MFWKKKPKPEPEVIDVPKEHVMEIMEMLDKHHAAPRGQDHVTKYVLWAKLSKICALTPGKLYRLDVKVVTQPKVVETIE